MNAYNPLEAMKRLEQAGIARQHAEAIAAEISDGVGDLVTKEYLKEQLDAALDKQTIKIGILMSAIIALACTVMGVVFSAS